MASLGAIQHLEALAACALLADESECVTCSDVLVIAITTHLGTNISLTLAHNWMAAVFRWESQSLAVKFGDQNNQAAIIGLQGRNRHRASLPLARGRSRGVASVEAWAPRPQRTLLPAPRHATPGTHARTPSRRPARRRLAPLPARQRRRAPARNRWSRRTARPRDSGGVVALPRGSGATGGIRRGGGAPAAARVGGPLHRPRRRRQGLEGGEDSPRIRRASRTRTRSRATPPPSRLPASSSPRTRTAPASLISTASPKGQPGPYRSRGAQPKDDWWALLRGVIKDTWDVIWSNLEHEDRPIFSCKDDIP
jgi:hypothetical protein